MYKHIQRASGNYNYSRSDDFARKSAAIRRVCWYNDDAAADTCWRFSLRWCFMHSNTDMCNYMLSAWSRVCVCACVRVYVGLWFDWIVTLIHWTRWFICTTTTTVLCLIAKQADARMDVQRAYEWRRMHTTVITRNVRFRCPAQLQSSITLAAHKNGGTGEHTHNNLQQSSPSNQPGPGTSQPNHRRPDRSHTYVNYRWWRWYISLGRTDDLQCAQQRYSAADGNSSAMNRVRVAFRFYVIHANCMRYRYAWQWNSFVIRTFGYNQSSDSQLETKPQMKCESLCDCCVGVIADVEIAEASIFAEICGR